MRPKTLSKRVLLIVVPLGFIFLVAILFAYISKNSVQGSLAPLVENLAASSNQEVTTQDSSVPFIENVSPPSNQEPASVGSQMRLKIPVIHIDAVVIPVGLTADGAMDVPKGPAEVAWYNLGPHPGEIGSAVLAGHYDWTNNISAVFDNLDKLREGDKLFVEDENGITTNFVVREIRTYSKDEDAADVFTSDDNKAHLNLITCTGVWNKAQKTYSERLVVFADKE